jgi:hypothetical protein
MAPPPPPEPGADAAAETPSSSGAQETNPSDEPRIEQLYSFAGKVIGASPAHPTEFGPLVDRVPPARVDTFEAPQGTLAMDVLGGTVHLLLTSHGAAPVRIEITGPNGTLVWASSSIYIPDGWVGCFGLCLQKKMGDATPGTYTVSYYVTGVVGLSLRVEATVEGPPSEPAPVVFAGHILAPEAGTYEIEACGGLVANLYQFSDEIREAMWNEFSWGDDRYSGWTYAFDVQGMVATFRGVHGGDGSHGVGVVPSGAHGVTVCSRTAVNANYNLILTPPGAAVFMGHIHAPDPTYQDTGHCSGYGSWHKAVSKVTSRTFAFEEDLAGRPFSFNVGGFVADFVGVGGAPASKGIVPSGATGVVVCSVSAFDAEFQLLVSP